jgi:hypothetical protein
MNERKTLEDKILESIREQAVERAILRCKLEDSLSKYIIQEMEYHGTVGVNGTFGEVLNIIEEAIKKAYWLGYEETYKTIKEVDSLKKEVTD